MAKKVQGKTFAFTGALLYGDREGVAGLIAAEGGQVVEDVTEGLDYLVVGHSRRAGPTAAQKKAQRLNQKGSAIEVIDEGQLAGLFRPGPEEALAMLRALPRGLKRWRALTEPYWLSYPKIDLGGADLRG